jgi:membrane-associated phospholipid phosphatase
VSAAAPALPGEARPADRVVAGYNLVLGVVWASVPGTPLAPPLAAAHLVGAALPFLLRRAEPGMGRGVAALRDVYPLLWILGFWAELDYLLPLLHPVYFDAAVQRLDRALFGVHWDVAWMARAPSPWLSESMHLLYMLFPLVLVGPPVAFAAVGRRDALRDVAFRLPLTYVCCCLVYLAFPAVGPARAAPAGAALTHGLFYRLVPVYWQVGNSLGTAFPSFHVAAAVTVAFVVARWLGRGAGRVAALAAVAMGLSTVYTRHHYAVDAVAGAVLALLLEALVAFGRLRRATLGRIR